MICCLFQDSRQSPIIPLTQPFDGVHPAVDLDLMKSPMECFTAFLSKQIVQLLCDWTNERAGMDLVNKGTMKVYGILWKDVSVEEMYVFLTLHLYMGIIRYPRIQDYWSRDFLCGGPRIFCSEIMSRNRFCSILKMLRFSNPNAFVMGRPATRLAMFFAHLKENCLNLIDPGETVAVDECLVLYKGRLHFRQFIKTKRSRFGMKLFCLCPSDPRLRGYTYNFALYFGKDVYVVDHISNTEHLSMSERVVVFLFQELLDQGREVILDNWYTSLRLAEFLLSKNTYVTGTIRVNRGVPKELTETPLQTFQTCFVRKGDVLVIRYKDKRDVYVLTTKLKAGFVEKKRFHTSTSTNIPIQKPKPIDHYNQNMGSVDAVDQDIEPYDCTRKSYTWFKKIGIHMIQRMVLNAKVLYSIAHENKQVGVLEFTKLLCDDLLHKYAPTYSKLKEGYKAGLKDKKKTLSKEHVLASQTKAQGCRRKRTTCKICYKTNKVRKYTSNFCATCPDAPAFCTKEHFNEFHNKQ